MTHPLTPREKVARIVDPWAFSIVANIQHTERAADDQGKALTKADAILTALASGSGDHAELAEQAGRDIEWSCLTTVRPSVLLDILAEIAALRAERDAWRRAVSDAQNADAENDAILRARATEAERELAEADRLLERIANDPTWDGPSSARLYFLNKETERG